MGESAINNDNINTIISRQKLTTTREFLIYKIIYIDKLNKNGELTLSSDKTIKISSLIMSQTL